MNKLSHKSTYKSVPILEHKKIAANTSFSSNSWNNTYTHSSRHDSVHSNASFYNQIIESGKSRGSENRRESLWLPSLAQMVLGGDDPMAGMYFIWAE